MPICQYVIVIELHKRRLFIYIPWTKSGFLTLFTYSLTGLFANIVFSFYGLSNLDDMRPQELSRTVWGYAGLGLSWDKLPTAVQW
jgi:hypothetical protein